MPKVIVYSKVTCPYCHKAKALLSSKNVPFEEILIDQRPEERDKMLKLAGGRTTVPQIFINEHHVGGCDDLFALEKEGKLDPLLNIKKEKKMETEHRKVIIIGSGPAAYTAAIYTARANLSPLLISGMQKGGQLTTTTEVENFPGFPEGVQGPELMELMEKQALRFETEMELAEVTKVELGKRPFMVSTGKKEYTCDALIISTGASAKYIGLDSEEKYKNRGVSACATCDGFFYRNQRVAVVGGGDTALEEAAYLTNFAEKVLLIHRRDEFRGSKAMQDRVLKNPKIEVVWNSVVVEVIGEEPKGMTDLKVKNVKTNEEKLLGVTGVFVAIGHSPNTELFRGALELDDKGYIITKPNTTKTNIEGVFACGDVMDPDYRQAITAAGTGCRSAIDAERWLSEQG